MKTNITFFAVVALGGDGSRTSYTLDVYPIARIECLHECRLMGVAVNVLGEFASQKQANQAVMRWAQKNGKGIVAE
jgi:hypothetical protein